MTAPAAAPSYVFGVVATGTRLPAVDEDGPAEGLRLVEADGLAAVVGTVPSDRSLGRAADLLAHDRVLGALVETGTAVLPMRFGAVLADDAAVVEGVLTARHDELRAELDRIDGRVQFTLTVHYEQDVVLREVLAAHPEIARLRDRAGADAGQPFDQRVRLGELVVRTLEQLRPADAQALLDELRATVEVQAQEPSAPDMVLNAAVLVDRDRTAAFERGVERIARRHHPRLRVRLLGPTPAYAFVGAR